MVHFHARNQASSSLTKSAGSDMVFLMLVTLCRSREKSKESDMVSAMLYPGCCSLTRKVRILNVWELVFEFRSPREKRGV